MGRGFCGRSAQPENSLPTPFPISDGGNLLITLWGCCVPAGHSAADSRQLPLRAVVSLIAENLLKQLFAGVSPCAGGCAQAEQLLRSQGEPKPPLLCSWDQRGCLGILQLVPVNAVPLWCHVSFLHVKDMAFPLQYFKPYHCKPEQQGHFSQQELEGETLCLTVVGNSPWAMALWAPVGKSSVT